MSDLLGSVGTRAFRRALATRPEVPLYHYTDTHGLLGILEHQEIHCTHLDFMNDRTELAYAITFVRERLQHHLSQHPPGSGGNAAISTLMGFLNLKPALDCYAFCLSEAGDDLSQWRAYGQKGAGYALEFDLKVIAHGHTEPASLLLKVVYEPKHQAELVDEFVEDYIHTYQSLSGIEKLQIKELEGISIQEANVLMALPLAAFLLSFKNPAFASEREWRLVTLHSRAVFSQDKGILMQVSPPVKTRYKAGKSGLTPYIALKPKQSHLPISHIFQGPQIEPAIGERALKMLLSDLGLSSVNVMISKIPSLRH